MSNKRIIKNICYILMSFPNPSETFIADEIESLKEYDVRPNILALVEGNKSIVQKSAKKLIDEGLLTTVTPVKRIQTLISIFQLLIKNPKVVLLCLVSILKSNHRWLYFQAAPYALNIANSKTDFIHAHFADVNFIWATAISMWTGIPFGVTTHGYDLRNSPIPLSVAKESFSKAHLVVTISKYNRDLMTKKFGIPSEQIKIVHSGVDLNLFRINKNKKRLRTEKLGLLNIGRLVKEKGQDLLIRALDKVKKSDIEFELTIIGAGELHDSLLDLCNSLSLDECVKFFGAQTQDTVIKKLQDSDIFILTSRCEGLPVVCIEAMASGAFVIASRINGIPELVDDKVNGLLVEPEDIDGFARAIYWVKKNRDILENMCCLAREKVEKEFDRKKCTKRLIDYMCEAITLNK